MRTREGSSKWVIAAGLLLLSQTSRAGAAPENQPAPAPQPCPSANKGIHRIRLSCLESTREVSSTAAAPTLLPAAGASDSATTDCSPAYWVDANGIRRLRPQCL